MSPGSSAAEADQSGVPIVVAMAAATRSPPQRLVAVDVLEAALVDLGGLPSNISRPPFSAITRVP